LDVIIVGAESGGLTPGLAPHRAGIPGRIYQAPAIEPVGIGINPLDAILCEVYLHTGDRPLDDIDKVIGRDEPTAISKRDKCVADYDRETLAH
jgi:hypothetical protein